MGGLFQRFNVKISKLRLYVYEILQISPLEQLAALRVSFQNTNSCSRQNTGHVRRNSTKFLQSIITKLF